MNELLDKASIGSEKVKLPPTDWKQPSKHLTILNVKLDNKAAGVLINKFAVTNTEGLHKLLVSILTLPTGIGNDGISPCVPSIGSGPAFAQPHLNIDFPPSVEQLVLVIVEQAVLQKVESLY